MFHALGRADPLAILRRLPDYEVDHSRLVRAETIGVTYGTFAMPITFTPGLRILG